MRNTDVGTVGIDDAAVGFQTGLFALLGKGNGFFNCWGLNSKDPLNQDGFRVLYYPEVLPDDALVRDFSFLENVPPVPPPKRSLWRRIKDWGMDGESHPPFVHPCAIRFQSGSQFPSFQDCTLHPAPARRRRARHHLR